MASRPEIATVVGARPQFIKLAPVTKALAARGLRELIVHTGQHYDQAMSDVFFAELGIPQPDINLGIGSGSHGQQTGQMLIGLEQVFQNRQPRMVIVYGDTNSTLAGALAAVKLGIPVAHVEAGLRSHNRTMPEEHNRVLVDHLADLLCCHHQSAVDCLVAEGVRQKMVIVGDVMRETLAVYGPQALARSRYPASLGFAPSTYGVLTVHRPVNADDDEVLKQILTGCAESGLPIVFPAHPRVKTRVEGFMHGSTPLAPSSSEQVRTPLTPSASWGREGGVRGAAKGLIQVIAPLGYFDMMALLSRSRLLLTDSGGLQKEAFFLGVPCMTLRSETEWVETVQTGWNELLGDRPGAETVHDGIERTRARRRPEPPSTELLDSTFGPANTSALIAEAVEGFLARRSDQ
jgi:UDP-N-acetylglucosamine 2-epimerase